MSRPNHRVWGYGKLLWDVVGAPKALRNVYLVVSVFDKQRCKLVFQSTSSNLPAPGKSVCQENAVP